MPAIDPNSIIAANPVYHAMDDREYTGTSGDYLNVGHSAALALNAATISMSFSLDRLVGDYALVSKDGSGRKAGDFTVYAEDGRLMIVQESGTETEYLKVPDVILEAHTTYQLGVTFGADGLMVYLNGALVAAEPQFKQGLEGNTHPLVIGGTRAWKDSDTADAHSLFKGTIGDVMVFDGQLGQGDMLELAGAVNPALPMAAKMQAEMADLMPLFEQAHHGSETLKEILEDYGVNEHGHMMGSMNMNSMGRRDNEMKGTAQADGLDGGRGDDTVNGAGGDDVLQGGYGNDKVIGGSGNDILDGGHGEDRLLGGNGNDLLISRADGREGAVFYDPNRDEGDPLGELTNGKLYPDQPIPADDVLTGGKGADIFYFQTLINAKQRYIEKHTRDDGTINWHGVAGENDKIHDHWVDILGDDVVTDFSRAEGDRLVIEGHTTQIASITYGDANGDGVMDHSVIALYSDQGSGGGAHNDDRLGTITVYGDLIQESDIEHTAAPAYGIVATVEDIKEAVKPIENGTDTGKIKAPGGLAGVSDLGLPGTLKPVMAAAGAHVFDPDEDSELIFDHSAALALKKGTVAFSFTPEKVGKFQVLFSKDASGNGEGHLAAYVNEIGSLVVRFQNAAETHYFEVDHAIKPGQAYDFAFNFGPDGAELYLNGARVAYDSEVKIDLAANAEAFVVGATGWGSTPGTTDRIWDHFDGEIENFMVFDTQLSSEEIFGSAPRADHQVFSGNIAGFDFARAAGELVIRKAGQADVTVADGIEFLSFNDTTVRVGEVIFGSRKDDYIKGRDGADVIIGKQGNDDLRGYDNDDHLRGGQGDDDLFGGNGRDRLEGDEGNDRLFGGDDADVLYGGIGNDDIYGEDGNDRMYGGLGDDRIYGHTWNGSGTAGNDRVYYDGNRADYSFETATWNDSNRGGMVSQLIITDSASGGVDGFYEGRDKLMDVDWIVFADQTVAFNDLL